MTDVDVREKRDRDESLDRLLARARAESAEIERFIEESRRVRLRAVRVLRRAGFRV